MKKNRRSLLGAVIIGALILFAAAAFAKGDKVAKARAPHAIQPLRVHVPIAEQETVIDQLQSAGLDKLQVH
jgi:hypothetical protein